MKVCPTCSLFYQEQVMACHKCSGLLEEVSLSQALAMTRQQALKRQIVGKPAHELEDSYKQYHIRSFLQNRSLFLDFDLHKNRLKHGRHLKRFFITPINITSVLNLPWFIFNVISTNLFHMQYTHYCPRCKTKYINGQHDQKECDYNIEYFNILDDILSGRIVVTKSIYQQYAKERRAHGHYSAYEELFCRHARWEVLWDLISIGASVLLWTYIAVYISFPMFKVLVQKLQQPEAYEWAGLSLR